MSQPQILINQMSFNLPTGIALFNKLTLTFSNHKTGLVGLNGIGKSTLIRLILGELYPNSGSIRVHGKLAYVPQSLVISPEISISELLGYEEKINALHRIKQGSIDQSDFVILNED